MVTPDEPDDEHRAQALTPETRPPSEQRPETNPPKPVDVSFWLWIAAGVVFVAGFAVTLIGKQRIVDELVRANKDPNIIPAQIESGTTSLLWVLLVGAIAFAVTFALFAYKAREGTRSARTVLTVLAGITLLFQLFFFASLITLVATLLALTATVLMYLPGVGYYFRKADRQRP